MVRLRYNLIITDKIHLNFNQKNDKQIIRQVPRVLICKRKEIILLKLYSWLAGQKLQKIKLKLELLICRRSVFQQLRETIIFKYLIYLTVSPRGLTFTSKLSGL